MDLCPPDADRGAIVPRSAPTPACSSITDRRGLGGAGSLPALRVVAGTSGTAALAARCRELVALAALASSRIVGRLHQAPRRRKRQHGRCRSPRGSRLAAPASRFAPGAHWAATMRPCGPRPSTRAVALVTPWVACSWCWHGVESPATSPAPAAPDAPARAFRSSALASTGGASFLMAARRHRPELFRSLRGLRQTKTIHFFAAGRGSEQEDI